MRGRPLIGRGVRDYYKRQHALRCGLRATVVAITSLTLKSFHRLT